MQRVRVLVVGYGNVGRGVLQALKNNADMELVGLASRTPERVRKAISDVPVVAMSDTAAILALNADVAILCGGSKNDLPEQGPAFAKIINTVDSFDNHDMIPTYYAAMDNTAKEAGKVAVISTGWDPGVFSLERTLADAFIPGATVKGFYGVSDSGGLSMGHSDALRTIPGVADARQYTHAVPAAMADVRAGVKREFTAGDLHTRECFVVLEAGADAAAIEATIKSMPGYFAPYQTTVNFVSQEELNERFGGSPHDGCVIASGTTGDGNMAVMEYRCAWGSNPEATANILVAHARAAARLAAEGKIGAFTILDIAPAYFSSRDKSELLKKFM